MRIRLRFVPLVLAVLALAAPVAVVAVRVGHDSAADHDHGRDGDRDADGSDPDAGSGRTEADTIKDALAWYYGQRSAPGTAAPAQGLLAAQAAALKVPAYAEPANVPTAGTAPAWTPLGPQPVDTSSTVYAGGIGARENRGDASGRVTSVAVVAGTNQIAYAGGADGGVWKTTDGGAHWAAMSDALATLAVGALTTVGSSTVWMGTGEANYSGDAYYGGGVYRSVDGGVTWAKRGGTTFDGDVVSRIAVSGSMVYVATNKGLYVSTDSGGSWSRTLAPGGTSDPSGNFVTDVLVLPGTNGAGILAAIGYYGGDGSNGLWRSTDKGATWTHLAPAGWPTSGVARISLAARGNTDYAVVASTDSSGFLGIYKTSTGPTGTWTRVATSSTFVSAGSQASACYGLNPGTQAWYDQAITIDPTNANHVVVGLEEVYDSANAGGSWTLIGRYSDYCTGTTLTTHPDQHALTFAVSGGVPTLYVGNDGGVYTQTGATLSNSNWVDTNANLALTQPYSVAASAGAAPTVVIGTQDNGTVKYTGGPRWPEILSGDGTSVAIEPSQPNHIYAAYPYLNIQVTTNGGSNWTAARPGDYSTGETRFVAPFRLDPTNAHHLVAVGRHVYDDTAGPSVAWNAVYDNGSGHYGTAVAVRGAVTYEAWCGACSGGASFARGIASNVGGTWHAVAATGLPLRYVTGLAIDPANSSHVFAVVSGYSARWVPTAGTGHVFESKDAGATFTDISANLPDAPVNDVVLIGGRPVVATDTGVYRVNSTGTWGRWGTGLPKVSVHALTTVAGTRRLLAASHGRGVYSLTY